MYNNCKESCLDISVYSILKLFQYVLMLDIICIYYICIYAVVRVPYICISGYFLFRNLWNLEHYYNFSLPNRRLKYVEVGYLQGLTRGR